MTVDAETIRSIFGLFLAIAVISGVMIVLGAVVWAAQKVLRDR